MGALTGSSGNGEPRSGKRSRDGKRWGWLRAVIRMWKRGSVRAGARPTRCEMPPVTSPLGGRGCGLFGTAVLYQARRLVSALLLDCCHRGL